jgi:hypothetical protein
LIPTWKNNISTPNRYFRKRSDALRNCQTP